jgi:nitrogen regulatory protein P-II 1
MLKIEAIIKPFKMRDVKKALSDVGITRMTVTEVKEFGCHHDHVAIYRGNEHLVDFLPNIKIEVVAMDGQLDEVVEAIAAAATTGKDDEGEILVFPIQESVPIRTLHTNRVESFSRTY